MAIYTIQVSPEYKDFAQTLLATISILLCLHVLLSGQKSTGLIGSTFNPPFSDTLTKVIISISFYYLVVKKIIAFE